MEKIISSRRKFRPSILVVILQTLVKTAELIGLSVKEDWSTESGISAALCLSDCLSKMPPSIKRVSAKKLSYLLYYSGT